LFEALKRMDWPATPMRQVFCKMMVIASRIITTDFTIESLYWKFTSRVNQNLSVALSLFSFSDRSNAFVADVTRISAYEAASTGRPALLARFFNRRAERATD